MHFGSAVATGCSTFAITNIDDLFVLVTFFAESSTNKNITPLKITIGQYVGFTIITVISMIGYGVAVVLPSEPIGFLGLLPILLGVWKLINLLLPDQGEDDDTSFVGAKSVFKVAAITVMNGGDNIGTYIPLFSQAEGATIAVYVVVYYVLLSLWCLSAFLLIKQKHVLRIAQNYACMAVPFLYIGLGIYIIDKSDCYPWTIERIDDSVSTRPGKIIMGVVTAVLLLACIGSMAWFGWRKTRAQAKPNEDDMPPMEQQPTTAEVTLEAQPTIAPAAKVS